MENQSLTNRQEILALDRLRDSTIQKHNPRAISDCHGFMRHSTRQPQTIRYADHSRERIPGPRGHRGLRLQLRSRSMVYVPHQGSDLPQETPRGERPQSPSKETCGRRVLALQGIQGRPVPSGSRTQQPRCGKEEERFLPIRRREMELLLGRRGIKKRFVTQPIAFLIPLLFLCLLLLPDLFRNPYPFSPLIP